MNDIMILMQCPLLVRGVNMACHREVHFGSVFALCSAVYIGGVSSLFLVHFRIIFKQTFLKDPISLRSVIFAGQLFQRTAPFVCVVVLPVFKKIWLVERFSLFLK